jgi:hypothetical protein
VLLEVAVLRRQDGLPEHRRDVLIAHHHTALGGELADDGAAEGGEPGDGVRPVVVENRDLRRSSA